MDRKLSKFAVGDEITTTHSIRNWATGHSNELNIEKIYSVVEDRRGITYRTTESRDYHQELVVDPKDAKKIALKFLSECMIVIAGKEEPCPHNS